MSNFQSKESREAVRALLGTGLSDYEIARLSGVPRGTVQNWRTSGIPEQTPSATIEIYPEEWTGYERSTYSYLLGQYLGDGHISKHAGTFVLTITCDGKYPDIIVAVAAAIGTFSPRLPSTREVKDSAAIRVAATWKAWPLFFPQHGPGSKIDRKIELVGWQEEIVDEFPEEFLRGLIHSDGARCLNTFTVQLKDGPREYSYPRYFFTNYSVDIQEIFCRTCDRLEIRWSRSNWRNISISHRDSVARLDAFIGPKS